MEYIKARIKGGYTLISPQDRHLIDNYEWFADSDGYATAFIKSDSGTKSVRLHILIAGRQEGLCIDHENRVRLDNRRENLRHITWKEQCKNRGESQPELQEQLLQREVRITVARDRLGRFIKADR